MTEPGWISQPVPPTGAITSEGIRNQLGRPRFDRLTVLVRESAQNSCDAAIPGGEPAVRYEVAHFTPTGPQVEAWQALVGNAVDSAIPATALRQRDVPLSILCVSDRGTMGLGGATRADLTQEKDDYVAFVLNVGEPRDKELGGGTYGFGKAVFFTTSSVGTIVAYTHYRTTDGTIGSRLIGIALGHSYSADGFNFTGRHWWGLAAEDGVAPLVGDQADGVATSLGLPMFEGDETGTTIAIVQPEFDDRTPEQAMQWVASAIGWHLWPKMLEAHDGHRKMRFRVTCEDTEIAVPSPETHSGLAAFAKAYRIRSDDQAEMLRCKGPVRDLGRLGLSREFGPLPPLDPVAEEAGISDGLHHVALMRDVNLIVRYESGPQIAHEHVWYTGVFKPERDLDDTFARAEPPSHDDWIFEQLTGNEKTFVRVAARRLDEALRAFAGPKPPGIDDNAAAMPLGAASQRLAGLLARAGSLAPGPPAGGSGGSGGVRRYRMLGDPRFEQLHGETVLVQDIEVKAGSAIVIEPRVEVALWGGGSETDPPMGATRPQFRCWLDPDGREVSESAIALTGADTGTWRLVISPVEDAATSITVKGRDG